MRVKKLYTRPKTNKFEVTPYFEIDPINICRREINPILKSLMLDLCGPFDNQSLPSFHCY